MVSGLREKPRIPAPAGESMPSQDTQALLRLEEALAGTYRIDREIGHGGMATVYLAHDLRHDREVAIKVVRQDLAGQIEILRFQREVHIAAHLSHPNILPLYDSGEAAGQPYYVMPYITGETLKERIRRGTQLPLDEALRITSEVADALGYAHQHGLVHRDIKPGNILLSGGHAVVADFGIARAISGSASDAITDSRVAIGTPEYMSPEQASADSQVDGRSDLYSLGCVLFEMLSGEAPFHGVSQQAVLARHRMEKPPSVLVVRPNLPPTIQSVVEKALAKAPADRFQNAAELVEAIRPERISVQVVSKAAGAGQLARALMAAVALIAIGLGVRHLLSGGPPAPDSPLRWTSDGPWLARRRNGRRYANAAAKLALDHGARYFIDGTIAPGTRHRWSLRLRDALSDHAARSGVPPRIDSALRSSGFDPVVTRDRGQRSECRSCSPPSSSAGRHRQLAAGVRESTAVPGSSLRWDISAARSNRTRRWRWRHSGEPRLQTGWTIMSWRIPC